MRTSRIERIVKYFGNLSHCHRTKIAFKFDVVSNSFEASLPSGNIDKCEVFEKASKITTILGFTFTQLHDIALANYVGNRTLNQSMHGRFSLLS